MGFNSQQKLQFFQSLSLYFTCSDQHVKYRMPGEFPSTGSLLLVYHVKQYIQTIKQKIGLLCIVCQSFQEHLVCVSYFKTVNSCEV